MFIRLIAAAIIAPWEPQCLSHYKVHTAKGGYPGDDILNHTRISESDIIGHWISFGEYHEPGLLAPQSGALRIRVFRDF